jgi:hypothetical protein
MSHPDATGYSLKDAVDAAVAEARTLRTNARTLVEEQQRTISEYEALLGQAMVRLCELGETAHSSALVRAIRDVLA